MRLKEVVTLLVTEKITDQEKLISLLKERIDEVEGSNAVTTWRHRTAIYRARKNSYHQLESTLI